jgi:hypothetical protein
MRPVAAVLDFPLVVIPGSQKAGTGTLFLLLARHRRVAEPRLKEPEFFALDRAAIERHWDWYRQLHRAGEGQLSLDASPFYLWSERAPENIRRHVPEARILITLRDPARRAFSSYLHMVKRGKPLERRRFDDLLARLEERTAELGLRAAERALLEGAVAEGSVDADFFDAGYLKRLIGAPYDAELEDPLWNYRYFGLSVYRDNVERFERAFPGRTRLIFLEELAADHEGVVRGVLEFLGLEVEESLLDPVHANPTRVPSGALGRWVARLQERGEALAGPARGLRRLGLGRLVDAGSDAFFGPPPRMTEEQRRRSVALLRDEYDYWHAREPRLRQLWPT